MGPYAWTLEFHTATWFLIEEYKRKEEGKVERIYEETDKVHPSHLSHNNSTLAHAGSYNNNGNFIVLTKESF